MKTLKEYAALAESRLSELLPEMSESSCKIGEMPWLLAKSMRYSLLAGGKRLRPSMMLACAEMLGDKAEDVLDFACAVEMIHTYSLIHDDLPGMDDDTLRRGRPTNHVVFGTGQAILAGDGLLNLAFETMLHSARKHPERAADSVAAMDEIARGCGVTGMIAGQVMDLHCEHENAIDVHHLEYIQRGKTACMFIFPLRAIGHLCGADSERMKALETYGRCFGLIFQETDDLLDVLGDQDAIGKTLGKDAASGKLTCVSAYGIEGTQNLIARQLEEALNALKCLPEGRCFFEDLIRSMVHRTH